jgi:hypothetical protein
VRNGKLFLQFICQKKTILADFKADEIIGFSIKKAG